MDAQQAPAAHVTSVTSDMSDIGRGVTFGVTCSDIQVTRVTCTSLRMSLLSARHDAMEPVSVTRVTLDAVHRYPPYLKRGKGPRAGAAPERAPASYVTHVTCQRGKAGRPQPDTSSQTLTREANPRSN